ncbi:hypothetical protein [Sorangium sp. So ce1024]|uniref:hypothetical protein n=1 Tax=Sorangium sp. So ce1024 TaxID=3133327 RepID=UPI003EFCBE8B
MKRSIFALGMMMSAGLLSTACGPESQFDGEIAGPGLKAMVGKPGSEDTNGTPKRAWHTWRDTLSRALAFPLLASDGTLHRAILDTGLLDAPNGGGGVGDAITGHEVFDHAVRCALATGTVVTHDGESYKGRGMVSGASVWTKEGLPVEVRDHVLECVIAFVNDKMDGVSVLLTAAHMNDDGLDHTDYAFSEAVWCASATAGGAVDVYPTRSFATRCGLNAKDALEQRYCHQEHACDLNYKGLLDRHAECEGDERTGHYKCGEKSCTMTWLKDPNPEWCTNVIVWPPPPTSSSPPPPPPPPPPTTPIPQ